MLSSAHVRRRCGRAHATALSSRNRVWVFASWGRPYVLTTPLFSTTDTVSTPLQVECGWSFSAVLTNGGEVYVWWPLDGAFAEMNQAHADQCDGDPSERVRDGDCVVDCRPWEVALDPWLIRPVAASLPKLKEDGGGTKIVKIAAGDDFLIGLTEGGHVLKANMPQGHASFSNALLRPRWEYVGIFHSIQWIKLLKLQGTQLEQFSEVEHIRAHPTFDESSSGGNLTIPETLTITHASSLPVYLLTRSHSRVDLCSLSHLLRLLDWIFIHYPRRIKGHTPRNRSRHPTLSPEQGRHFDYPG
jgi:SCF-associated factor 1